MKYVLTAIVGTFLLSITAMGFGGGVDVGNHNQKGRFTVPVFSTEESMVEHVNNELPQIEKGEHPEVKKLIKKGRCSSKVIFDFLEVNDSYRWNRTTKKLEKEFSGDVVVVIKDCKKSL